MFQPAGLDVLKCLLHGLEVLCSLEARKAAHNRELFQRIFILFWASAVVCLIIKYEYLTGTPAANRRQLVSASLCSSCRSLCAPVTSTHPTHPRNGPFARIIADAAEIPKRQMPWLLELGKDGLDLVGCVDAVPGCRRDAAHLHTTSSTVRRIEWLMNESSVQISEGC